MRFNVVPPAQIHILVCKDHAVTYPSNTFDFDVYQISIFHIFGIFHTHTNTRGSASKNDCALLQSSSLRDERDNFWNMEQEIRSISGLSNSSVTLGGEIKIGAVAKNLGKYNI